MTYRILALLAVTAAGCEPTGSPCPDTIFFTPPAGAAGSSSSSASSSSGSGGSGGSGGEGGAGGAEPLCQYDVECASMTTPVCVVGRCVNGQCAGTTAPDGTFCVPAPGTNPGVCFDGVCVEDMLCDDGNECTDDFVNPDGVCVGLTVYVHGRKCAFGEHEGVCIAGACACDTDDDCDDGDASTADACLDAICFH